ncbi:hypothetical protein [Xenorhabdus doucetiae]|uniref:Uncharacterized protein n=1 Tax=Xenorhabdus doucetiae TaxID=351671 RepID=A0A068QPS6_9GAMM|nr:hypothetical protein [Xenorhabdus doucetiae]TYP04920.1 hypothetical protein LY16_02164 [Xenorhabdus doucetiae]CDG16769.1 conserved protein of unknown function [Xenorhabdus doucetiae]
MNVIWRAVCFCYDNMELPFTEIQDEWVVFVDAPDRKTALAKYQALLPVIWDVSPDNVEHFSPLNEAELLSRALRPDAPHDLALLECSRYAGKPRYLTADDVLFWVSSPRLQQRLVNALNRVSKEVTDGYGS